MSHLLSFIIFILSFLSSFTQLFKEDIHVIATEVVLCVIVNWMLKSFVPPLGLERRDVCLLRSLSMTEKYICMY